jgi:hypothetical protein
MFGFKYLIFAVLVTFPNILKAAKHNFRSKSGGIFIYHYVASISKLKKC